MVGIHESERAATNRLRLMETINQTYPKGWFVGMVGEQVVGAAASFRDLECQLKSQGLDPRTVLVVEAGVVVPEHVTIFV
jgi:hypothetical protein